jgi:hypothetical protein
MIRATDLFYNPSIRGHSLVKPVLWYGRNIKLLFSEPLPRGACNCVVDLIARLATLVTLAALSVFLFIFVPVATLGWAVKYYSQSPLPAEIGPIRKQNPQVQSPVSPVSLPSPAFVPFTKEVVEAAQAQADELVALYNDNALKDLSSSKAQVLFEKIALFRSLYDKHRDPDATNVNEMTKIFNTVDEIIANTSGMKLALDHWTNFYKSQANHQDIIPQLRDGNCWLHTSIIGLEHINHPLLGNETHLSLRPKVVRWMQSHYEEDANLRRYIDDAMEAHKAFKRAHIRMEMQSLEEAIQQGLIPPEEMEECRHTQEMNRASLQDLERFSVEDYFRLMFEVGTHGSHAELYAISRMFKVNVSIWRDIPPLGKMPSRLTKEFDEQIKFNGAEHTVNAVLTREGNHFDYRLPQQADGASGSASSSGPH